MCPPENVRLQHLPPLLDVALRDVARVADAGVVHHDVQPAELLDGRVHQRRHLLFVAHVHRLRDDTTALRGDRARHLLQRRGFPSADGDGGSFGR